MHCPRCGQQQVSDETKFCSRCGFQLGLVAELLMNNGFLPQLAELYTKKSGIFTRKNGVIFTVLWFIFWVMMIPAFAGIADAEEVAGVSAVFGLFTTIMLLILSLGFLPSSRKRVDLPIMEAAHVPPASLYGNPAGQSALPPQQSQPANTYVAPQGAWRTPDTGELVTPGSVTDTTTKLLKRNE
jgi:hypothetical protein